MDTQAESNKFEQLPLEYASLTWAQRAKYALAGAVLFSQVTPINESIRYPAIAFGQYIEPGPVSGALTGGVSTLLVEGAGALAAAELLTSKSGERVLNRVNGVVDSFVPEDAQLSKWLEGGLMIVGGSSVAMIAKQRDFEDTSKAANIRYGMKATGLISVYVAAQGAGAGEVVDNISWTSAGIAAIGVASLVFGVQKIRQRLANAPTTQAKVDENLR